MKLVLAVLTGEGVVGVDDDPVGVNVPVPHVVVVEQSPEQTAKSSNHRRLSTTIP